MRVHDAVPVDRAVDQAVDRAIRDVGAAEVVARFQALASHEIGEKSPGDFVTIADQECERVLSDRLRQIRDIPVIGEEAAAVDPGVLDLVDTSASCWVIDPIDGTSNFVAGSTDYAVMVSLVEGGEMSAAWVWHPHADAMLHATTAADTTRDGVPVARRDTGAKQTLPTGVIKSAFMPPPAKHELRQLPADVATLVPGRKCAGIEYAQLIDGEIDFLFYWRTLPWDHAPGGLLAQQAGLRVARLDGSTYRPGDGQHGLLSATPAAWEPIAAAIRASLAST